MSLHNMQNCAMWGFVCFLRAVGVAMVGVVVVVNPSMVCKWMMVCACVRVCICLKHRETEIETERVRERERERTQRTEMASRKIKVNG